MKSIILTSALCAMTATVMAQQVYELSAPVKEKVIYTGHLKLGGTRRRRQH